MTSLPTIGAFFNNVRAGRLLPRSMMAFATSICP